MATIQQTRERVSSYLLRFNRSIRFGLYLFEVRDLCREFLELMAYLMDEANNYTGHQFNELKQLAAHFRERVASGWVWLDGIELSEFEPLREWFEF